MKPFDLKLALKTRTAKDLQNRIWELQNIDLIGDTRLLWGRGVADNIRFYGETDLDGKVMFGECADLYSAEVEETTQVLYAVKKEKDKDFTVCYMENDYPQCNVRYKINFNMEDREIKSIYFEKVG